MPISKQCCGNGTRSKTKLSPCLNDMIRLRGTYKRIPSEPSRPMWLLRANPPARIGREPPRQMVEEVIMVFQFLHPGAHLSDLRSGDSRNEPAELVTVERVQVVRDEVSGFATAYQPFDRLPDNMRIVTCHDHGAQRKCRAPGNR